MRRPGLDSDASLLFPGIAGQCPRVGGEMAGVNLRRRIPCTRNGCTEPLCCLQVSPWALCKCRCLRNYGWLTECTAGSTIFHSLAFSTWRSARRPPTFLGCSSRRVPSRFPSFCSTARRCTETFDGAAGKFATAVRSSAFYRAPRFQCRASYSKVHSEWAERVPTPPGTSLFSSF